MDILTRQAGAAEGASLHLEGGVPGTVEAAGAPEGTTITVRDLFYNTPARLKFMRKDSAETAAVNGLMQHLALSHPDISFKFIKDGQEALHTPGDGKLDSAVYAALGRDFAHGLVPVEGRGGETAVSGFITAPLQGRGSRSMQVFFVNGRFIKSQLLTAALEEGYRNQIMKGKFPGCVLSVTLPVTAVDVNVHPAKTQVKFAREREVFDAVYHTVLDALDSRGAANAPAARRETVPAAKPDFFQTMDARTFREQAARQAERPAAPARPAWNTEQWTSAPVADSGTGGVYRSASQPRKEPAIFQRTPIRPLGGALGQAPSSVTAERREAALVQRREMVSAPAETEERTPETRTAAPEPSVRPFVPAIPEMAPQAPEQVPGQTALDAGEAPWRIAGEVLNTYIICEDGSGNVWLIDKHAAHERINFDRLMAAQEPPMRQTLLSPVAAELGREDGALLLENLPLLEQLGFSCEDFGGGAVLVREVPADIDPCDVSATLEELAECLRTGRSPDERRENLLHTMACKAAIKGGWKSDPAELRVLVEKVQSGAVRFCPHGRPVAVRLTKYELEKMFKRA